MIPRQNVMIAFRTVRIIGRIPGGMIMKVYENNVAQFKKDVRTKRLVNFLCAEYEASAGKAIAGELRYVCKYVFLLLYDILESAGAGCDPASGIRIDLEENAGSSNMKLIFASSEDTFRYSLLGIYAGSGVKLTRADDIVCFREGNTRWTTIHPSLFMYSFARRLFRGIPEDELQSVNYECASFLFDCFYSCDSDIITDYADQLTNECPVFYANDTEELTHFLEPVISRGGGIRALRKLSAIEARSRSLPLPEQNEDQIYLLSSITNNVRRHRKAWYVIEEAGNGNGGIVSSVMEKLESEGKNVQMLSGGERPDGKPDLIIISQEDGGTYEQLKYCRVSIFLCDSLRDPGLKHFEKDAALTARAEHEGAQLTIALMNHNACFADGGKGMRWLVNRLQLAGIRREDYDPALYEVLLVNSKKDFEDKDRSDMAHVVLPANVVYDPESGRITMQKNQKKGIFNAIASGRNGAMILCENAPLRNYLRGEISALQQRQKWIRNFISEMAEGGQDPEKQMDALAKESEDMIREVDSRYQKKARGSLGKRVWNKMSGQSRTWIVTAMMAYDNLKEYDRMVDFSGICVQIGKACEYELKKRIFSDFVEYEMECYGEERCLERLPDECFEKQDKRPSGQKKLLQEEQITLGKLRYITGLDDSGKVADPKAWDEFKRYAEERLLVNPANSYREMKAQMPVIEKIRDEYRNPSAHSHSISIVEARECLEYVVTVQRKLGVLLEQYRV